MSSSNLAVIVPTRDRPEELSRLLDSLAAQSCPPAQVIVIGEESTAAETNLSRDGLSIDYYPMPCGSSSTKRNFGISKVGAGISLIAFMDDDSVLDGPHSLRAMIAFWDRAPASVGGAGFNWVDLAPFRPLWHRWVPGVRLLGLYDERPGIVLRSGMPTVLPGRVNETCYFGWLPSTAVVYRRDVCEEYAFDEWQPGRSVLEDVDFSYQVGKKYHLAMVAEAGFLHLASQTRHDDPFEHGEKLVVNLLHFARKHEELSVSLCVLGLLLRGVRNTFRCALQWDSVLLKRTAGHWKALLMVAMKGLRPIESEHYPTGPLASAIENRLPNAASMTGRKT